MRDVLGAGAAAGFAGAEEGLRPLSKSAELLRGGGRENGETRDRPFLLFNVFLDLGEDLCGFKGTLHGGAMGVFLDETMCAAADNQSRECCLACWLFAIRPDVDLGRWQSMWLRRP